MFKLSNVKSEKNIQEMIALTILITHTHNMKEMQTIFSRLMLKKTKILKIITTICTTISKTSLTCSSIGKWIGTYWILFSNQNKQSHLFKCTDTLEFIGEEALTETCLMVLLIIIWMPLFLSTHLLHLIILKMSFQTSLMFSKVQFQTSMK